MTDLKPGNLVDNPTDFSAFADSMAAMMEAELNTLLELDDLPPLPDDPDDREVRDRRRFMIAIARGVVRHLAENSDAFVIDLGLGGDITLTINWGD